MSLRNSLIPLLTLLGPLAVGLMTGSWVLRIFFAILEWSGIGEQFVKSGDGGVGGGELERSGRVEGDMFG